MPKNLVIVESPAKAKTIEKYLGSDYVVKSSFGHIRDLPSKGLSIDKDNNFEPSYQISDDKKKVAADLRKAAKDSKEVWLASDEDREGEAIAWHLCHVLGLEPTKTKRIVFHEITKPAIEEAVKNPRTVDINLVDAQQARRVLDRLVGYELSPVLWKKVQTGLSAGRVQSVAVRLIVEREREIENFEPKAKYKISAIFIVDKQQLKAELNTTFTSSKEVKDFFESILNSTYTVEDIITKPSTRNPSAPFTTSSLQQEASAKLGFSVKQTMTLAQRLYENGHITYMRTDSTNLSSLSLKAAEKYITNQFGKKYHHFRTYKTKNSSAQEAHEAIRPSDFANTEAGDDASQQKLYKLIWRRTLASQMAAAETERSEIIISIDGNKHKLVAKGEILKFDGFYKVYGGGKDDTILPNVKIGEQLKLDEMRAIQAYDKPPARYSEASLVRRMEELGIGRPSTYAPTISTIQSRGYIEKSDSEGTERTIDNIILKNNQISEEKTTERTGSERAKLLPTHLADIATDFLVKHFSEIIDYDFTAKAEKDLDKIAGGQAKWQATIAEFYKDFSPLIEKSADVTRAETSKARILGVDPKSGKTIIARYGRYGPMLQKGETEDDEKPQFAPLPDGSDLKTVVLEQALEMFKLPRFVGKTTDGHDINANIGRFGPYIQVNGKFISIKPYDPMSVTLNQALEIIKEKQQKEADKYISQFANGISIINGPYGPYITDGKKNARIPKDTDAKSLTELQAKDLLDKAPVRKKRSFRSKK